MDFNLFWCPGPGAPAVLANMVLHAASACELDRHAIGYLDENGYAALETTPMPSTAD